MINKLRQKIKGLFSKRFIHPIIDTQLSTAIDDKINRRKSEQQIQSDKYNDILNSYLRTYFSKTYDSQLDMMVAFKSVNKKWKTLCRDVNSTNPLINLKKDAFQNQVKLVVNKVNEK